MLQSVAAGLAGLMEMDGTVTIGTARMALLVILAVILAQLQALPVPAAADGMIRDTAAAARAAAAMAAMARGAAPMEMAIPSPAMAAAADQERAGSATAAATAEPIHQVVMAVMDSARSSRIHENRSDKK